MSNLVILSNLKLGYAKKKKMSTIFFVASVLRDVSDSARAKKMQQKWNLEAYNVFLMKIEWLMFFLSLSLCSLYLSHTYFFHHLHSRAARRNIKYSCIMSAQKYYRIRLKITISHTTVFWNFITTRNTVANVLLFPIIRQGTEFPTHYIHGQS